MTKPPTNSAAANCQPINIQITKPSSITKFVLANMNIIEAVKSAPLANKLFASALAAYEHDELTMPKIDARATVLGLWSPNNSRIRLRDTKAWIKPDSVNPKTKAQKVSKNIHQPSSNPLPILLTSSSYASLLNCRYFLGSNFSRSNLELMVPSCHFVT